MSRPIARFLLAACLAGAAGTASAGAIQAPGTIRAAAGAFLRAQHPGVEHSDLQVRVTALDPRLRLPHCSEPLRTFLAPGSRTLGNTTVGVRCRAPRPWTIYVPARVSIYRKVLVAARPLPRGTRLSAADVRMTRKDVDNLAYGYLSDPTAVQGKLLRRLVPAGMALDPEMLESPPLVKRGQQVVLLAEIGGLQVRMTGLALATGAAGDSIKVRNLSSRRVVEGVIVRTGVVRVPL